MATLRNSQSASKPTQLQPQTLIPNTAVEAGGALNGTAGTNPSGNVLSNDTDPNAADTKTVTGVVAGTASNASGSVGATITGAYGSIQIAADGSYTYTVDNLTPPCKGSALRAKR